MGSAVEFVNSGTGAPSVAAIINEFGGLVYGSALRLARDPHLAEDITQAVFILLLRKFPSMKHPGQILGWLLKTTYFVSRDALRQKWRREKHEKEAARMHHAEFSPGPYPEEVREVHRILDRALVNLRACDRDLVVMRFLRESSLQELAHSLQISEHAVRKRLERALERLKIQLAKNGLRPNEPVLSAALLSMRIPIGAEMAANVSRAAAGSIPLNPASAALVRSATQKFLLAKLTATVTAIVLGGALARIIAAHWFRPAAITTPAAFAVAPSLVIAANVVNGPDIPGYPIAAGWPISLPGSITSTPSVVNLNGRPCIVVTCMARAADGFYYNPRPDYAAQVYAFHPDGTIVAGFPVQIMGAATHRRLARNDLYTEAWFSSPSAIPDRGGNERIALTSPFGRGVRIIDGNGKMKNYPGGNQWNPCSVIDMGHDGVMDIIMGNVLMNADGGPVTGWPASRKLTGKFDGFGTCIGDANADGHFETYILHYRDLGLGAFDDTGRPLPDWPDRLLDPVGWFAPAMGDIDGDGKKEIVSAYNRSIMIRRWNGALMPHTRTKLGILVDGVDAPIATPTLADLDGTGKADIVVYDAMRHAVMAWRGDGAPLAAADGTLAVLNVPDTKSSRALEDVPWAGISVADLGGDGIVDLFCGPYWLKFNPKTKQTTVTKMLPGLPEMNWNQPTIADLHDDGHAEIILGLRDGRVAVYNTGMTYDRAHADWPTCNGNFQHTSVWNAKN